MRIVLDTNILLQSLAHRSNSRPIWDAFLHEKFTLILTTSILLEYHEILAQRTSERVANNVVVLLRESVNSKFIDIYYEWNVITKDVDDNKFFDAAVAGNADYLVSNDNHFNEAMKLEFPKINIVNATAFLKIIKEIDI
jgi:putative PIN family toxin of toxin-antitoxin system